MEKGFLFILVFFRVAGTIMVAPIFGNPSVPTKVKIALSLFLALGLFPIIQLPNLSLPHTTLETAILVIRETGIGIAIGLVAVLVISSVQIAGQFIGVKMGFGVANIVDPATQSHISEMATFYTILAGLLFLALDGHHIVLQGLAHSFQKLPVARTEFPAEIGMRLSAIMIIAFEVAFKLAAPVFIALTLTNVVFGIMSKSAPQMNVFFSVGFILTIMGGLALVAASLPIFRYLLTQMVNGMDGMFVQVLRGA